LLLALLVEKRFGIVGNGLHELLLHRLRDRIGGSRTAASSSTTARTATPAPPAEMLFYLQNAHARGGQQQSDPRRQCRDFISSFGSHGVSLLLRNLAVQHWGQLRKPRWEAGQSIKRLMC